MNGRIVELKKFSAYFFESPSVLTVLILIHLGTQQSCEDLKGLREIWVSNSIQFLVEFKSLTIFLFTCPFVFQKYLVQLAVFLNKKLE